MEQAKNLWIDENDPDGKDIELSINLEKNVQEGAVLCASGYIINAFGKQIPIVNDELPRWIL